MAKERIVITVKGRVGIGKSGVTEVIRDALRVHYGNAVEINAHELDQEYNLVGKEGLHHPDPERIKFVINEQPLV